MVVKLALTQFIYVTSNHHKIHNLSFFEISILNKPTYSYHIEKMYVYVYVRQWTCKRRVLSILFLNTQFIQKIVKHTLTYC